MKDRIFSAIQPSGVITLGNYIGALKNWVDMQDEFECIYALADLHTITVRQDPKVLRKNTLEAYALLLACGIDPHKSLFFIQSHVHTHAELSWILSCYTQFGELSRMTQFKQKSTIHSNNINVGLFSYPCLQAADILLYQADYVPVGADQKQHLELSRDIAVRFNNAYSDTFKVPEPYIPKVGAKIMSLADPTKKMSKSDSNVNAFVCLLDDPDTIVRKFKRAVTDSDLCIKVGRCKEGINNLIGIYSSLTGKSSKDIEIEFDSKGYGEFKLAVAEATVEAFRPIRQEFEHLIKDKAYLSDCYTENAKRALAVSGITLNKVMKKIGLIKKEF